MCAMSTPKINKYKMDGSILSITLQTIAKQNQIQFLPICTLCIPGKDTLRENIETKGANAYYYAHNREFHVPADAVIRRGAGIVRLLT